MYISIGFISKNIDDRSNLFLFYFVSLLQAYLLKGKNKITILFFIYKLIFYHFILLQINLYLYIYIFFYENKIK